MMRFIRFTSLLVVQLAIPVVAMATTWNEPWHSEVVRDAQTFGLYQSVDVKGNAVNFHLLKHLAGINTGGSIEVNGFYALTLDSYSPSEPVRFEFKNGSKYYLLLKRSKSEHGWEIATPTSGFAEITPQGVVATYRISTEQAYESEPIYELTQICIYRHLHGAACSSEVYTFIDRETALKPAILSSDSTEADDQQFFEQHAALETAYLIGYSIPISKLQPFLDCPFFQVQVSAVRALGVSTTPDKADLLLRYVENNNRSGEARIMAVLMLKILNARQFASELKTYEKEAPADEVNIVGDIMDPRVGTTFPESVQAAIQELLKAWKS